MYKKQRQKEKENEENFAIELFATNFKEYCLMRKLCCRTELSSSHLISPGTATKGGPE